MLISGVVPLSQSYQYLKPCPKHINSYTLKNYYNRENILSEDMLIDKIRIFIKEIVFMIKYKPHTITNKILASLLNDLEKLQPSKYSQDNSINVLLSGHAFKPSYNNSGTTFFLTYKNLYVLDRA